MNIIMKLPERPQAMVARPHTTAIAVAALTRPTRSATSEIGKLARPTVSATTLTSEPSCVSVKAHSVFRKGKTAFITCRDM